MKPFPNAKRSVKVPVRPSMVSIALLVCIFISFNSAESARVLKIEYQALKAEISRKQIECYGRFQKTVNEEEKDSIVSESRVYIFKELTDNILPAWYGTKWGFYGNSRIPGQGEIACGNFVIFTLQDASFKIISRMANQPSENIISNLTSPKDIRKFWNAVPMNEVLKWIKNQGEGLFVVGLDFHIGYLIYRGGKITFCHSNYYPHQPKVVNDDALSKSPLTDSKYRVIGKILNDRMMRKWIQGGSFPITYDHFRKR